MISVTIALYVVFGTIVTISLRRPLRALVDARRQSVNLRKALAAADDDLSEPFAHQRGFVAQRLNAHQRIRVRNRAVSRHQSN